MNISLSFEAHLPAKFQKKGTTYIGNCHILDVVTQGETLDQAKKNLAEAIELFLITCYEMGTLDDVLKDCGFTSQKPNKNMQIRNTDEISVKIPFYLMEKVSSQKQCRV